MMIKFIYSVFLFVFQRAANYKSKINHDFVLMVLNDEMLSDDNKKINFGLSRILIEFFVNVCYLVYVCYQNCL